MTLNEYYQAGYRAKLDGKPLSDCPYKNADARREAWVEGWFSADGEARPGAKESKEESA